jgi:hypothetical protein
MDTKTSRWLLAVALAGLTASVAVASPVIGSQSVARQGTRLPSPQGPSALNLTQGTRLPSPQGPSALNLTQGTRLPSPQGPGQRRS